tara:strand:- start:1069 stop:1338 length:270 start_codon:yes stop_codon:yes gene_type:complete
MSVYSGQVGKCCCGCAGNSRYASEHREEAGSRRGYEIDDDEISDRSVSLIVGKIAKELKDDWGDDPKISMTDSYVSVDTDTRTLTAYYV